MADAEFIINVGVRRSEIGDGKRTQDQALKHWLVDDSARDLLVGANGLEFGVTHGGRDEVLIDAIKVDHRAIGIGL